MPNKTSRAILTKVYILGKNYKTVASDIDVSYRHFLRLNDKALNEFQEKYLKVVI
jgi:DNA-directed RNA polymerase specialized sigma subunit